MCGIAGFTGKKESGLLRAMTDALVHRGPDDEGFAELSGINLGMRRLSIVDLDTGRQPIHNEDKSVWVVFNGEIYNHAELRRELLKKGHHFYTDHSDTEVLVHLYEEHGPDFVRKLNGMFAIALWDSKGQKLFLYRDRMGKKPLFYARSGGEICFASEIKALLKHPGVSREPDRTSLANYFSQKNTSAPRTAFRDVSQLPAGHELMFSNGSVRERAYWKLDFSRPLDISEEDAAAEIAALLEDAVKMRMQCDVPFGAYLSGGIDSSSVVSLMCRQQSLPVKTFCLGYEDDFKNKQSDLLFAREISARLGTDHHEYLMSAGEVRTMLPKVLGAFDEPFSGTISTYFISQLIRRHVKVALSGDGADELFGSYLSHRLAQPIQSYLAIPAERRQQLAALTVPERDGIRPFDTPEQFAFLGSVAAPTVSRWRSNLTVFSDAERAELLGEGFEPDPRGNIFERLSDELTAGDSLNQSLEMDQKELLPNQVFPFVDRLSMAHSVEVRVPFMDYRLVEFAARLPGGFKIRDGINKYILKKAVRHLLPEGVIARPKEGFVLPVYAWMRGALKDYVCEVLSPVETARSGMVSPAFVEKIVREFYEGKKHEAKIWNLVCFQVWWNRTYG